MLRSIVVGLCVVLISHSFAAEVIPPKPDRYFNDYVGVVSKEAASRFNEQLAQFERETSDQVVVAVFPKMQSDSDIADYTQRVSQAWGVGQKEQRNGVVLFVFVQDRKMFLQVGYGLEGALPDATAFDITERHIKPLFRTGNYEAGLATGIDLICKAIRGEYTDQEKRWWNARAAARLPVFCPSSSLSLCSSSFRGYSENWAVTAIHREEVGLCSSRAAEAGRPVAAVGADSAGSAVAVAVSAEAAWDRAGNKMRTREFLSKLEHDRIIQAIHEAE